MYDPAADPRPFTSLFWASRARFGPLTPLGSGFPGDRPQRWPSRDLVVDPGPVTRLGSRAGSGPDPVEDLLGPGLVTGHVLGLFAALGRGDRFDPALWYDEPPPEEAESSGEALSGDDTVLEQDQPDAITAAESRAGEQIDDGFLQWSDLHRGLTAGFAGFDSHQQHQGGFPGSHPSNSSSSSSSSGQEGGPAAESPGQQQGAAADAGGSETDSSRLEQQPEAEYISGATAHTGPGQTGTETIPLWA